MIFIKGIVIELGNKPIKRDNPNETMNFVLLFQRGEKTLSEIKKIPTFVFEKMTEGQEVLIEVKMFNWATDTGNKHGVSYTYVAMATKESLGLK